MSTIPPRKWLELVFDASCHPELSLLIHEGVIGKAQIRLYLREVVQEIGIGHTNRQIVDQVAHRILHDLAGRF